MIKRAGLLYSIFFVFIVCAVIASTRPLAYETSFPNSISLAEQSGVSTLPLLSSDGMQYVGGFRLPAESANGVDFSFGGQPMAFNPATGGLFVGSLRGAIAEISIPTPVNNADVNALPFAAYLQPFADPTEGHLGDISTDGVMSGGLMVYGDRLYGTAAIFYDANNTQRVSHYSRSARLNQASFSGWSQVWETGRSGFVSGWMTAVPSEWQSALGGRALTGQCCIPIAWRTSWGPSAFAFNPAEVGQPAVSASPLLYYTDANPTLGPWEGSNPTYGATTAVAGMVVVAGTRTALYVGRNGIGPHCYGNGTPNQSIHGNYSPDGTVWCYDPTSSDKGSHAYPYRYQAWAYDLNDFAAVKAGTKQPWEVVPYGVWPLNLPTAEATVRVGGVAYDAQRQLLYVSQRGADPDGYASRAVIHAFRLAAAPGANTSPEPSSVNNVVAATDKPAPQPAGTPITLIAQSTGGVAPQEYKWVIEDGDAAPVAANWTTSNRYTWTPTSESPDYRISVWVRSSTNHVDAAEASTSLSFPISAARSMPAGGVAPHQSNKQLPMARRRSQRIGQRRTVSPGPRSTTSPNHRAGVRVRADQTAADPPKAAAEKRRPIKAPAAPTPSRPRQ